MSTPPESPLGLEQDPGMEAREGSPRQGQLDGHSAGPLDSLLIPDPLLTPVFLPGEFQERGSLVGCRLWGRTESDMTEVIILNLVLASTHTKMGRNFLQTISLGSQSSN